jgi:putative ABC transport system ATP-binding protein
MTSILRLENIKKSYILGKVNLEVLKGISLEVQQGEMVAIMGPSGSGKTTLLNLIGCLDRPTSGKNFLDGKEVSNLSRGELAEVRGKKIGFIFQTFNLLPQLSAKANVELGMRYGGMTGYDGNMALEALKKVGLEDRARHRPSEMSGGEQQRVAVARALVKSPPLILADEPTGNLDTRNGAEVMSILTSLHTEHGITLVMITHELRIAHHCQRVIHIEDGLIKSEETVTQN